MRFKAGQTVTDARGRRLVILAAGMRYLRVIDEVGESRTIPIENVSRISAAPPTAGEKTNTPADRPTTPATARITEEIRKQYGFGPARRGI